MMEQLRKTKDRWYKIYIELKRLHDQNGVFVNKNNYRDVVDFLLSEYSLYKKGNFSENTLKRVQLMKDIGFMDGKFVLKEGVIIDCSAPISLKYFLKAYYELKEVIDFINNTGKFYTYGQVLNSGEKPLKVLKRIEKLYKNLYQTMFDYYKLPDEYKYYESQYKKTKPDHWNEKLKALEYFILTKNRLPKTPSEWYPYNGKNYDFGQLVNTIRRLYKLKKNMYTKIFNFVEKLPGWSWNVNKNKEDYLQKINVLKEFFLLNKRFPYLGESFVEKDIKIINFHSYYCNIWETRKKPEVFENLFELGMELSNSLDLRIKFIGNQIMRNLIAGKANNKITDSKAVKIVLENMFDCKFRPKTLQRSPHKISVSGVNLKNKVAYLHLPNNKRTSLKFNKEYLTNVKLILDKKNIRLITVKDLDKANHVFEMINTIKNQVLEQSKGTPRVQFFEELDVSTIDFYNSELELFKAWEKFINSVLKKTNKKIKKNDLLRGKLVGVIAHVVQKNSFKYTLPAYQKNVLLFYEP